MHSIIESGAADAGRRAATAVNGVMWDDSVQRIGSGNRYLYVGGAFLAVLLTAALFIQFAHQAAAPAPGTGMSSDAGHAALLDAIFSRHPTQVRRALVRDDVASAVNAIDNRGFTPLAHAARLSGPDGLKVVEELLAHGADVHLPDASGSTVLMQAARAGNTRVARLLLAAGADPNAANGHGETALHWAAECGDGGKQIAVLLMAGADPWSVDEEGRTPRDWALRGGNTDTAELLTEQSSRAW